MSKIISFRVPAEKFSTIKGMNKGPISKRAANLLEDFVKDKVEVTDRPPNAFVGMSVSVDEDLFAKAKEKAASMGMSIHFVVARLLELDASGELHPSNPED